MGTVSSGPILQLQTLGYYLNLEFLTFAMYVTFERQTILMHQRGTIRNVSDNRSRVSHTSVAMVKCPDKSNLGEGFILAYTFRDSLHRGREDKPAAEGGRP